MTTQGRWHREEAALSRHALRYPESHEDFPWGHRAVKVKGKLFLILSGDGDTLRVTVKLPLTNAAALALPFASPTGYGLGKSGWVTAQFDPGDDVPVDMLEEWIDESFRAVAPRKLVATLDGAQAGKRGASKSGPPRSPAKPKSKRPRE